MGMNERLEKIRIALGLETATEADKVLREAQAYTNAGKATVFFDKGQCARLAELLVEQGTLLNYELNEAIGWQFSQALFWLRRKWGWKVKTVKLTREVFAYRLEQAGREVA